MKAVNALPYILMSLKPDLSLDDCIDFLNAITEQGQRKFRNLFVALPLTRLHAITKQFPDAGITFGATAMNSADPEAFTQPVAAKMIKDAHGQFVIIGTKEERSLGKLTNEQLNAKLKSALHRGIKTIFCFDDKNAEAELSMLKDSELFINDPQPILVYEIAFENFRSYFPTQEELKSYYDNALNELRKVFGEASNKLALLIALPADLVGFSAIIEKSPFEGAFFIKSGIYPHAVHKEAVDLIHVHCDEKIALPPEVPEEPVKMPIKRKPRAVKKTEAPSSKPAAKKKALAKPAATKAPTKNLKNNAKKLP